MLTGVMLAGLVTKTRLPLRAGNEEVDVSPSMHWPFPSLLVKPEFEQGPVLVQIEYKIDPKHQDEFAHAMNDLSIIRKRDGAFFWGLFRHEAVSPFYNNIEEMHHYEVTHVRWRMK